MTALHKKSKKHITHPTDAILADERAYLFTGPSQIAGSGKGLFTAVQIYKDEVIAVFKGRILSAVVAKQKAALRQDAYFINMPDGTIMDCNRSFCFAKYANDASGFKKSALKNNAVITLNEDDEVCLVALTDIHAGAEVCCSYGRKYWQNYRAHLK